MSQPAALQHAVELIRRPSVTPEDGGCQDYIEEVLKPHGFHRIRVDAGGVTNSIYFRHGEREGMLAFAGHTDVVPTGPQDAWPFPPFGGEVADGMLQGRGAQDMKAAVACWLAAVEHHCRQGAQLPAMQLLITSDEEGESIDGTIRLVEEMQREHSLPDGCVIGEPSSSQRVGDVIRRGRRGVVQIVIDFIGKQGHSAYPQDADNAIHIAAPVLARIVNIDWGETAEGFPPTSCQITNLTAGTGAMNVIPGICRATIDIRYNPGIDYDGIHSRIEAAIAGADVAMDVQHQASAFSTADGPFLDLVRDSIRRVTGIETVRDTGGGTSDGRFLAAAGVPVAELGLTNSTIHQVGECVAIDELQTLTDIYIDIIEHFEV